MQPRTPNPASWWGRLTPHSQPVESAPEGQRAALANLEALAVPGLPNAAGAKATPDVARFDLLALPELPATARWGARVNVSRSGLALAVVPPLDSDDSRIGQAMHRLLEWLPVRSGAYVNDAGPAIPLWSKHQIVAAARQLNLDSAQMALAARMAEAIATGNGSWAWDAEHLQWHQNEVPISRGGRLLRIDRLVQTRRDGQWWVLDYKSKAAPQLDADLCAQLLGYRAAIAQATPGQLIRAAFLTPQGALIEINTP
jgi:ATP-dependent helicase/nuclease subunit A